ncbi:MAG: hypothetical protein JST47_12305 [Bacteroidetes bacterium]|nr:hypothetical protein [Bacteroidota bacterium]MBS1975342.1 hypothetical protein [Bacteroidota bacterium]
MVFFLHKYLVTFLLIVFSCSLLAATRPVLPHRVRLSTLLSSARRPDTTAAPIKKSGKICSCEILALQTNIWRQRNFVLLAEKTNKKSFSSDLSYANRAIEKEKRHMRCFFYDKVEVISRLSDAIDCRSMYKRLKSENKSILLYDILDADVKR